MRLSRRRREAHCERSRRDERAGRAEVPEELQAEHEFASRYRKALKKEARKLKRRWLRVMGWLSGSTTLTLMAVLIGMYLWASSNDI